MEGDMYAVARSLDPNPTYGLRRKAGVILKNKTIFEEYESIDGSTERIKFILMRFATNTYFGKVDSYKQTALHLAAYYGHTKLVALIINAARYLPNDNRDNSESHEAFVRQGDDKMNTALHLAVKKQHVGIVKLLVEADRCGMYIQNSNNETPIYLAASLKYNDIVMVIGKACIAPTFDGPPGITPTFDGPGHTTALHAAIKMRPEATKLDDDVVEVIIKAAKRSFSTKQFVAFVGQIDTSEDSALHLALRQSHLDVVKLIAQYAEPTISNHGPGGQTALHAAIIGGNSDCIDFILKEAEDLATRSDEQGLTPLWLATKNGQTSTVEKLLKILPEDSCASVNDDGQNILHFAAFQSDIKMIKCILASCPAKSINKILNEKDLNGNTPLHLLIHEGCFVRELIKHKEINRMAKNNQHYTAPDMLYLDDEIIADQLQIKNALDATSSNSNTRGSLVPPSKRSRKDEKFIIAEEKLKKKGLELYRERTTTQIIVTALITTVTFTVGFTMPGGYHQSGEPDEGTVLLKKKTVFNIFMVADALALVLSTTSLFLYFISSMYDDTHKVANFNAVSTGLNIFSVVAMMLTFIAGTYVVLSHSRPLAITVCVICCAFFLFVIGLSLQMIYDRRKIICDRLRAKKNEV